MIGFIIALYMRNELLTVRYKLHRYGITRIYTAGCACCDTSIALFLHKIKVGVNVAPDFSFWNIQKCTTMNDRFSYALIGVKREKFIYISIFFSSITRRVQFKINPKFY